MMKKWNMENKDEKVGRKVHGECIKVEVKSTQKHLERNKKSIGLIKKRTHSNIQKNMLTKTYGKEWKEYRLNKESTHSDIQKNMPTRNFYRNK